MKWMEPTPRFSPAKKLAIAAALVFGLLCPFAFPFFRAPHTLRAIIFASRNGGSMNPAMSEELALFMAMHALDSAFGRVLQSIHLLASKNALSPDLVQTSTAFIETVQDHINRELRKTLGDTNSSSFAQFSRNLSELQSQLIAECLAAEPATNSPGQAQELTFAAFDQFRHRKTEDA
jgi:hypothetical protein